MVSIAPAATTTAIVRPTTKPVERAVRQALAIATLLLRHREGHHHARAAALACPHLSLAAELHRQAMDERKPNPPWVREPREPWLVSTPLSSITSSTSFPSLSFASMRTSGA